MAIRVALIGTGNCGSLALKQLVNDARPGRASVIGAGRDPPRRLRGLSGGVRCGRQGS